MPYIVRERRPGLDASITRPENPGDLNYLFTKILRSHTSEDASAAIRTHIANYIADKGLKYQYINDVLGALVGTQMEDFRQSIRKKINYKMTFNERIDAVDRELEYFYFNLVGPYEDLKIEENGDVE